MKAECKALRQLLTVSLATSNITLKFKECCSLDEQYDKIAIKIDKSFEDVKKIIEENSCGITVYQKGDAYERNNNDNASICSVTHTYVRYIEITPI